jgi:hypothetical protein
MCSWPQLAAVACRQPAPTISSSSTVIARPSGSCRASKGLLRVTAPKLALAWDTSYAAVYPNSNNYKIVVVIIIIAIIVTVNPNSGLA